MERGVLGEEELFQDVVHIDDYSGPLREWLAQEHVQLEVKRRFRRFLVSFQDSAQHEVYQAAIEALAAHNRQSLEVSYLHLSTDQPTLAIWLADAPKEMLTLMDEVARTMVLSLFPDYSQVHQDIHVRICDLPIKDSLRELRHLHLNALIKVSGVVTRRTGVFPQLKVMRFTCMKCGTVTGPITHSHQGKVQVGACVACQSAGPFSLNTEQTVYQNYQKITLQESPGSVPAGRVPRYKDVILLADLIDAARPGEEVEITGVYTHTFDPGMNTKQGFPVFSTVLEANYVQKKADALASTTLTEEEKAEIEELSKDPRIGERIIQSIAPSIYGNTHVKTAAALAMFGGREKNVNNKHRIRGDINVLLLGDPGTAKSQVLKYVEKTASRAVYTTGKGASAVGLTASVHRDPITREWTLEGGALVLADRGVCLIDEFDKMNDADRTSIHEAMEQQSISISKAGIVTTLQARCSVIAAANPIGGRYDPSKTFIENVTLTDPILQRFDILCVLQDTVDPIADERLASFVVNSHTKAHPAYTGEETSADGQAAATGAGASEDAHGASTQDSGAVGGSTQDSTLGSQASVASGGDSGLAPISQDLLRKYIVYAKQHCKPALTEINQEKIAQLYADLRRESEVSNGIPMAVRHIESMMRMSESHARMHLRSMVTDEDVNMAIRMMLESFIQAQKFAVMRTLRRQFAKYMDHGRDFNQLLMFKLQELVRHAHAKDKLGLASGVGSGGAEVVHEDGGSLVVVPIKDLQERARRHGIQDLASFLRSREFTSYGFKHNPTAERVELRLTQRL